MKTHYNRRANYTVFAERSKVWLRNQIRRKGKSPKLQPNWYGLFTVIYRIQKSSGGPFKIVHLDRLAPY